MTQLKEHIKLFIIQHLACFDTPSEVVSAVKDEFGIDLNRSHIALYDPTNHSGRELGVKLKKFFYDKRKAFLEQIDQIPLASKHVRLNELSKMYYSARKRRNDVLAKDILEQIAKEVGGIYTNKISVSKDNDPLLEWAKNLQGGSIPIAYDIEDEFTELKEEPELKQTTKKRVNWVT
ncbi:MAG: DUF2280 domain-containing protein [Methylotenera sp.]